MATTLKFACTTAAVCLAALSAVLGVANSRGQEPGGEPGRITERSATEKPAGPAKLVNDAYRKTKTAKTEGDFVVIIELLDEALKGDSLSTVNIEYAKHLKGWAHNKRGEALAEQGKDVLALAQFEQAVELNPDHWKARQNRGVSYAQQGKLPEAIAEFSRVIELNGNYANAWFSRGEVYFQQGDAQAAIRDYNEAIRRSPEDAGFYEVRGNAYHQLRRYDEALADYNRAIEFSGKKSAIPYIYRGDTNTILGNFDQAAQDYRHAIQLNERFGRAYQSTAWLMATCPDARFRDPQRAVLAARKAIELDGAKRYQYVETLAAAEAAAGHWFEATKAQKQAIAMAPESVAEDCRQRLKLYERQQPYRMRPRTAQGKWGPAANR